MARHAWLTGILLLGCGPERVTSEAIDLERICGVDGPVPLLEIPEGEVALSTQRAGEDELFVRTILRREPGTNDEPVVTGVWVIDDCGEHKTPASLELTRLYAWDDLRLACVGDDLVEIDALDDRRPRVLARRGCSMRSVAGVHVARDAAPGSTMGRLVALRPGPDGTIVETLVPEILTEPELLGSPRVVDDRVFERTPDLALISVDPRSGEAAVEIERVAQQYAVSPHHLVYRLPPDALDDDATGGPVILRDRTTGTEIVLADTVPISWNVGFLGTSAVFVSEPYSSHPTQPRWFWTADGSEILPPSPGVNILGVDHEGVVWLERIDMTISPSTVSLFHARREETPYFVMSCRKCNAGIRSDGLEIIEYAEGRFSFARSEGGVAFELAVMGVGSSYWRLHDDRVVTVQDVADEHGTLMLHDHRDGTPKAIATDVTSGAVSGTGNPDEILYTQRNPGGGHTLHRARLPPVAE